MPTVAELGVVIDASGSKKGATDYEKAQKRIENASKRSRDELGRFQKTNKKTSDSLERITKRAKQFAAGLLTIVAARKVLSTLVDFESGLVGVGKTADLAGLELAEFGSEIIKLSRTIPVSTSQLLEIAQAAGQLGVKGTDNILLFTDTIAKLGSASNLAGEEAATLLARILNVSGEGVEEVAKLASVLVELGNNSAATEREIALITTQVAQATAAFTVSSAEAAGLSAALASLGVRAQLGASAVARTFRTIDAAIRGQGQELRLLAELTGQTETEITRIFRTSNIQGFQLFIEGLGRVIESGGDATTTLARFGLSGEEILKILPTLATKADLVAKSLKLANDELEKGTALEIEASKAFDTLGAKIQLLKNEFSALLLETRGQTTALGDLVKVLTETVGLLAGLEDASSRASSEAHILAGAIKALGIAFGVLIGFKVAAWVTSVAVAIKSLALLLAGASLPVLATTLVGIAALSFTGLTTDTEDLTIALGRFLEIIGLIDAKAGVVKQTKDQIKATEIAKGISTDAAKLFNESKTKEAAQKIKEIIAKSVEEGIGGAVVLGLQRNVEEVQRRIAAQKEIAAGGGRNSARTRGGDPEGVAKNQLVNLIKIRTLRENILKIAREAEAEGLKRLQSERDFVDALDAESERNKNIKKENDDRRSKEKTDREEEFSKFFEFEEAREARIKKTEDARKKAAEAIEKIQAKVRAAELKRIERADDSIKSMFTTLDFERELIGKTNDERERSINVRELERQAIIAQKDDIDGLVEEYIEELEELQKFREIQRIADDAGAALARFTQAGIDGFKDFNSAVEQLIRTLSDLIIKKNVLDPIAKASSGFFAGLFSGAEAAPTPGFANTGRIPIQPGLNRHGGITTGPELFSQNGGTGLRGENGPEAILPLLRDAQGNLGVAGGGGGGGTTNIKNDFRLNITTPDANSFRSSRTQIQRQMAAMAKPVNANQLSGGSI